MTSSSASLSLSATVILQAVAHGYLYGFDIMDLTGLPGGTVYSALRRLEDLGHVTSRWEKHEIAQREQRPPRKYYEVTKRGTQALADALKRYRRLEYTAPPRRRRLPAREET